MVGGGLGLGWGMWGRSRWTWGRMVLLFLSLFFSDVIPKGEVMFLAFV